jgi:hypothetical protein
MGPDGKILQPGGGWWSPYGDTDEEIRRNMRANKMPNAPNVVRVNPGYFTGTKKGDEALRGFLGSIGALGGQAKEEYDRKQEEE